MATLKRPARHADIVGMPLRLAVAVVVLVALAGSALAAPRRVILLRHGEKANGFELTPVGIARAQALAQQFLGKDAILSLFRPRERPAGILSITLHTIELISPVAETWGLPQVSYSIVPDSPAGEVKTEDLNRRTQEAHRDLMRNRAYRGKTVIVCWEHKHIADAKLEDEYPGERVTWRQLLELDRLPDGMSALVPTTWPGDNYDYFWIVTFDAKGRPRTFESKLQAFTAPWDGVPQNPWGEPE